MSETKLNTQEGSNIQPKPGMGPIDVASQHVKGSMEWLLELLGKGDELTSEMKEILANQAQELLEVLQIYQGEVGESENDFDISELEKVTTFWADRKKKTRGGRSAIEFMIEVYGEHGLERGLNKAHILKHDPKLYMALLNWARDDEKKQELEKILPQGRKKYDDEVLTIVEREDFKRLQALHTRERRKK